MDLWPVGDFCTLPTPARPHRVSEFDELFRGQINAPHWIDSDKVEFTFASLDGLYEQVSDLLARETACCSFFDFSIVEQSKTPAGKAQLVLRVAVPAGRHDVLEALTDRAERRWTADPRVPTDNAG
jgi:hypothetical protein